MLESKGLKAGGPSIDLAIIRILSSPQQSIQHTATLHSHHNEEMTQGAFNQIFANPSKESDNRRYCLGLVSS